MVDIPTGLVRVEIEDALVYENTVLPAGAIVDIDEETAINWLNRKLVTLSTEGEPTTTPYQELKHDIKLKIIELLFQKERDDAIEMMVDHLKQHNHIYTIISDEKQEVWIYDEGIYKPDGVTMMKQQIREIMTNNYTPTFKNQIIERITADTLIDQKSFFTNNYIDEVVVQNGLLNVLTKKLKPFNPERIHFNKLPLKYDTDAVCPNVIKFLKDILNSEEDLIVIQELVGYLLLKVYKIEKSFMLTGTGRNGKSKLMDLMEKFVGPENCTSIGLQQFENNNFAVSELHNKMVNMCGEVSSSALKNTGTFKDLTGRGTIAGDRKFKNPIYFENFAKLIFATNNLPMTFDNSPAFWMRWVVLDFPYIFLTDKEMSEITDAKKLRLVKIRNPDIIQEITTQDEMNGLLNWGLEGLERLLKQKDFSYTKSTEEVKIMWIRKSDSFAAFCMDKIETEYGSIIKKGELRHVYNLYCKEFNLKSVGDKLMKEVLTREFGVTESRDHTDDRNYVWEGIKFKDKNPKYASWVAQ